MQCWSTKLTSSNLTGILSYMRQQVFDKLKSQHTVTLTCNWKIILICSFYCSISLLTVATAVTYTTKIQVAEQ